MISSGSDNRKKKATRRQVLSLAGGATLALGTLGMMTFGAAATAYAQTPTAMKTLAGSLTIGSPTTVTSPTVSQSDPVAGATNNQLNFEVTANAAVGNGTAAEPAVELQGTGFHMAGASVQVTDLNNGLVLGSLTPASTQYTASTTATNPGYLVASASTTNTLDISSGDVLRVTIDNVANSLTASSGSVSVQVGTYDTTVSSGLPPFKDASPSPLLTANSAINPFAPAKLTLLPDNNPGQLTELTYTFNVANQIPVGGSFTVDLTSKVPGGNYSALSASLVNTADTTLSVSGTSETSDVTVGYTTTSGLVFSVDASGKPLPSGSYSISVPVAGSSSPGVESVAAQYMLSSVDKTSGSTPVFVTAATAAPWGFPIALTSVTASNPYADAVSTVTIDFTDPTAGSTPITVAGLGLSASSYTLGSLTDTTTNVSCGDLTFMSSDTSSTSVDLTSGDSYSLTLSSVTLPSGSTTVDVGTVFAPSASTTLSLGSALSTLMTVTATTLSPDVSSNWTLSGIETAASLASGSTLTVDTTANSGSSESYFPTSAGAYKIIDLTNSADTQTASSVSVSSGEASFVLSNAIPSGDVIKVTVSGIVNDPTANVTSVDLTASGNYLETVQTTAPSAASDAASGAIANASGALYEWAGGYAFHLPTIADAGRIEASEGNPTQQKQSVPSASVFASGDTLTAGTLVQGVQSGTVLAPIYVVGSNGDLYHIASPSAFFGGGYAPKDVVKLPQRDIAMMTMAPSGSTTPAAYSVQANGSFWQTAGGTSIYEWVGGVAVHVASPADLVSIAHSLGETVLASWPQVSSGTFASQMAPSVPKMGTVVKVLDGSSAGLMYVSTGSAFVPISATQLSSLGYPASDVLEVSTTAGIAILG
ncbi:hypothetical protein [Ferrimicrobium sp.]|uniref:beta strand repeat-containing protein n=1 Tax=Ferrimicrobium sp. TaxID=2926050 RepID=UPI00261B67D2|nr:hypothetical protein [Ferrimicrobium sp.]